MMVDEPQRTSRKRLASDIIPECSTCKKTFKNFNQLLKHTNKDHHAMTKACEVCGKTFSSGKLLAHHRQICTPPKPKAAAQQVGKGRRQSLGGNAQVQTFEPLNDQDLMSEMKLPSMALQSTDLTGLHHNGANAFNSNPSGLPDGSSMTLQSTDLTGLHHNGANAFNSNPSGLCNVSFSVFKALTLRVLFSRRANASPPNP